ncbi:MAG: hypothetical protein M3O89_04185 [Actinomycetota bacterium]|nr:hypothetical protein [Actinomycetota bacterium]
MAQRISRRAAAFDCAFLGVVTAVSLVVYVGHLGFYLDDYATLERMHASPDHSLGALYHAVRPGTGQRPLQAVTFAVLYRLFGLHPLGYHLSNAALLVAIAALLYLVLRELRLPRLVCVAVPLVYSTLPHYSTDRFWVAAFPTNVSSLIYLISLYAALRAVQSRLPQLAAWVAIAVVGVPLSLFAYEVVFPLFALNVALVWWVARRLPEREVGRRNVPLVATALVLAIVAAGAAKTAVVAEQGQNGYQIGFQDGVLHHLGYLVAGSVKLNAGTYFLALPYVLWWIVRHHFSLANAGAAVLSGALVLGYLLAVARRDHEALAARRAWRALVGVGLVVFVLGYAIFITNDYILFRSAGIDNRVNAGAALGVAAILVGGAGLLAARVAPRLRALALAGTLACAVAAGVFVIDTLSSYWTAAAREQRAVVTAVSGAAGPLAPSSTVVLDGTCPEIGPAVVFASQWDFRSALEMHYGDPSLQADVATEGMQATGSGLVVEATFLGRLATRTYPYGPRLYVYDPARRRLYSLPDRRTAAAYLAHVRPSFRCPPLRSFAWGFDPEQRLSLL